MSPLEVGILSLIILLVFLGWRYYFVNATPCRSKERMDGKTVLITGGNTGIGKETAIDLARRGAKVILACRDETRASKAVTEIKSKAGSQKVLFKKLDLASLASVRTFCDSILSVEEHIDVLIANAGVFSAPYQLTEDGYEPQFAANHLGHFLLILLLLDRIKSTPSSRILVVASDAHYMGSIDLEDIKWMKSYRSTSAYGSMSAYSRSKLANVMFVRELAKRLIGTGVTVYAIHPGTINTNLTRDVFRGWAAILKPLVLVAWPLLLKTPTQGAQTSIYCAVAKETEGVSGKYWADCALKGPSERAMNDQDCQKLWEISSVLVGL